jgi:beta-lactamase class A
MADRQDDRAPGQPPASHPSDPAGAATLAERVEALLAALGGRSAIAARWFAPAAGSGARVPGSPAEAEVRLRADQRFPAASLAKLPIAVELLRRVDLGAFDLSERFDVSATPHVGGGSVLDYLDPGWQPTLADLCSLMLAVSDNTASNFVLDLVGMGEVNETMTRLGLRHTHLARRFMDMAARVAGRDNVVTAADMLALLTLVQVGALPHAARLCAMLMNDALFAAITYALPTEAQIAHKSGTLDDTIHDAGFLTGPGGTCVYCVLTTEQPDRLTATVAVGRALRALWDAWCAPA